MQWHVSDVMHCKASLGRHALVPIVDGLGIDRPELWIERTGHCRHESGELADAIPFDSLEDAGSTQTGMDTETLCHAPN